MSTRGVGRPGAGREELAGQERVEAPQVVSKPEAAPMGGGVGNRKQVTIRAGDTPQPPGASSGTGGRMWKCPSTRTEARGPQIRHWKERVA